MHEARPPAPRAADARSRPHRPAAPARRSDEEANGDEARAAAYDNGFEFIKDRINAPVHPLGQNVSMYHCIGVNDRADDDIKFALPATHTW